ncbi:hypothetical protein ACFL20_05720 [Spirochaetota bacterium]
MKRIAAILIAVIILSANVHAQEGESENTGKASNFGITCGIDFYSHYLWRGYYFYGGDGAFLPFVSYNIMNSGLIITFAGEIAASYVFDGKDNSYTAGYENMSADFGLDYSRKISEPVTVALGIWYWYYPIEKTGDIDTSFLTVTASIAVDVVLQPKLSFTYDYYPDKDVAPTRDEDFYIQLSIGHSIDLLKGVSMDIGLSGGFYRTKTLITDGSGNFKSVANISDITISAALKEEFKGVTLSQSFNYIIVPAKDFYSAGTEGSNFNKDINRFFVKFGAAYSL